ncbi:MAG: aldo/keto reductase, partial [Chloroflexi bacterium]|nr:aldo/keto reductase [Chloroflexota bacterium]
MDYRKLGRTGLKVSPLCLGTMTFGWTSDEQNAYAVFDAAFDAGINFIDTADVYTRWHPGNPGGVAETYIGKWIKNKPRDQIILATKVRGRMGEGVNDEGLGRAHMMSAVEASLKRLQTDYIDLYQSHSPDDTVPIEETLRAYDDLVRQGKVRYIGASNYNAWRLMKALWTSDKNNLARYDCLQPRYNLVWRAEFERELIDVCRTEGIGVIPYSPIQGGFLSGKYKRGQPAPKGTRGESSPRIQEFLKNDRAFAVVEKCDEVGKKHNKTIAQVAIAWLLANPVVTSPIIGVNNVA